MRTWLLLPVYGALSFALEIGILNSAVLANDSQTGSAKMKTSNGATSPTNTPQPMGDNSQMNQLHDGKNAITADQQKNNGLDLEIARKIRRSITQDKSLSTYAHNVKIIALNGEVVLKGPVRSAEEKQIVENTAAQVAGKENVRSEIEITPK